MDVVAFVSAVEHRILLNPVAGTERKVWRATITLFDPETVEKMRTMAGPVQYARLPDTEPVGSTTITMDMDESPPAIGTWFTYHIPVAR